MKGECRTGDTFGGGTRRPNFPSGEGHGEHYSSSMLFLIVP